MTYNADEPSDDPGGSLATPASFTQDTMASNPTESPSSVAEVPELAEQHPCSSAASTDEAADAPEGSLKVQESLQLGVQSSPQPFPLPDWLLEHCVTLRETWEDTPDCLDLLGDEAIDKETGMPTKAEVKRIKAQDLATMPHAMDETWFDGLLSLVRPEEQRSAGDSQFFTNDIVHIHSPIFGRLPTYRTRFLTCVIKQFAKTIDADLVVLDEDDLKDFSEICWDAEDPEEEDFCAAKLFEKVKEVSHQLPEIQDRGDQKAGSSASANDEDVDTSPAIRWTEPSTAILDAAQTKRRGKPFPCGAPCSIPCVIFLSMEESEITDDLLGSLRKTLAASSVSPRTIVLVAQNKFENKSPNNHDTDYLGFPNVKSVQLVPVRTSHIRSLFQADEKDELRQRNIRYLKRRIRRRKLEANIPSFSMPHARWDFLEASQTKKRMELSGFRESKLVEGVLKHLEEATNDEQIIRGIVGIGRKAQALATWKYPWDPDSDSESDSELMEDEWSKFPEHAQKHLREISQDEESEYELEQQLLPLLVDPVGAEEALASIAVDEEMVKTVKRVVEHHQNPDADGSSYGILEREQTGGALFYGPPGTGKTLLARVLAATTNSIVISASTTDIQAYYTGESPKVIKALFRLARLIAPSIIFIDEADAVFSKRAVGMGSSSNYYRQTTSQLLTEMDGFKRSKNEPLVILATNLPTLIDPAVLRRVPHAVYLGLPSMALREQIFQIMLKGEVLETSIDMTRLARMTRGYSGSDIKSLCTSVAVMCDNLVESGEDKGKRLLTWKLFEQALAATSGTKTTGVRDASRFVFEFAKRYDPVGYRKMQQDDEDPDPKPMLSEQTTAADRDVGPIASSTSSGGVSKRTTVDTGEEFATNPIPVLTTPLPPVPMSLNTPMLPTITSPPSGVSAFSYTPLPDHSKTIRLLKLHPSADKNAQVTGDLITVDLDDQTQFYQDFLARLTERLDSRSQVDRSLTRHFMWNLVNIDPLELLEPKFTNTLHEVAQKSSLYSFCDRPLELMRGLVDRHSWGDFLALSYVWGDPTKRQKILLNGIPFGVGDNLHAALVRLRSSYDVAERGLKIWIDAICINQNDLRERSVEVQKMGLIYTEALVVRGWLEICPAPHLRGDLSAIRTIWDLEAGFFHEKNQLAPLEVLRKLGTTTRLKLIEDIAKSDETIKTALLRLEECLFAQAYWERLWVIQEMAQASSLVFWYEQEGFFITPIESHPAEMEQLLDDNMRASLAFGRAQAIWNFLRRSHAFLRLMWLRRSVPLTRRQELATSSGTGGSGTLDHLILQARLSRATDPRDKIFGMLAILPDRISSRIEPRYGDPVPAVWATFARICFEEEGNLVLLARVSGRRNTDIQMQGLPSWAFDLTNPLEEVDHAKDPDGFDLPIDHFKDICRHTRPEFSRRFAADEDMPSVFAFSDDGQQLVCRVVFVDFVSAVTMHERDGNTPLMIEESQAIEEPPPRRDLNSAKLSLGRVLNLDSKWQPPDHPTLFDIPFPDDIHEGEAESVTHVGFHDGLDEDAQRAEDDAFGRGEPVSWAACFRNSSADLKSIFIDLMPYADFELHGIPLREYFTSDKETCPPPEVFNRPTFQIDTARLLGGLFRTREGRIGTLMHDGRPGDRIAVVGGCDVPLILRPQGKEYVIVDNCYVDGLMDGQAAGMVARGEAKIEEISIC